MSPRVVNERLVNEIVVIGEETVLFDEKGVGNIESVEVFKSTLQLEGFSPVDKSDEGDEDEDEDEGDEDKSDVEDEDEDEVDEDSTENGEVALSGVEDGVVELDSMTVRELTSLANSYSLETKNLKTKTQLIKAIQEHVE